jgi:hypothetical protein
LRVGAFSIFPRASRADLSLSPTSISTAFAPSARWINPFEKQSTAYQRARYPILGPNMPQGKVGTADE